MTPPIDLSAFPLRKRRRLNVDAPELVIDPNSIPPFCLSWIDDLLNICESEIIPNVLERNRYMDIIENVEEKLRLKNFVEFACVVCDELHIIKKMITIAREEFVNHESFFSNCKILLTPDNILLPLSITLRKQYDVTLLCRNYGWAEEEIKLFENVVMSKAGIFKNFIIVCKKCYKKVINQKLRKFAIANNNTIGYLPECLIDMTPMKIKLCSLVIPKIHIKHLRGGGQSALQSHGLFFEGSPDQVALKLPRIDPSSIMKVIATSSCKGDFLEKELSYVKVKLDNVIQFLNFLKTENIIYMEPDIVITEDCVQSLSQLLSEGDSNEKDLCDVPKDVVTFYDEEKKAEKSTFGDNITIAKGKDDLRPRGFIFVNNNETKSLRRAKIKEGKGKEEVLNDSDKKFILKLGNLVKDHNPKIFEYGFPNLFPFGRGGCNDEPRVKISKEKRIKHWLKLSSKTFARDHGFLAIAFDMLSRLESLKVASFSIPREVFQRFSAVTKDEYEIAVNYQKAREKALFRGVEAPPPPQPQHVGEALKLLSHATYGSGHMWNSKQNRLNERKKIFSLVTVFGNPHIFFTFNPFDFASMSLYYNAIDGIEYLEKIFNGDYDENILFSLITEGDRFKAVSENPFAVARWFKRLVDIVIKDIFNFDIDQQSCTESSIFGPVIAFVGGIEEQIRGTLHVHFLIWIAGIPPTRERIFQKIKDDLIKKKIEDWINSVVTCSHTLCDIIKCPNCNSESTSLIPHIIDKAEIPKKVLDDDAEETKVIACLKCNGTFSNSHVFLESIKSYDGDSIKNWDIDKKNMLLLETKRNPYLNGTKSGFVYHFFLEKETCEHDYHHRASCFRNDMPCRYKFYRDIIPLTFIDILDTTGRSIILDAHIDINEKKMHMDKYKDHEDFDINVNVRRLIGSCWLNSHSSLVLDCFKCNNDIRILIGNEPSSIYYTAGYLAKDQQKKDFLDKVLSSAFCKRVQYEEKNKKWSDMNEETIGRGRMLSSMYNLTNSDATGLPLASYYILNDGEAFCHSHSFHVLHIPVLDNYLKETLISDVSLPLNQSKQNGLVKYESYVFDYINRGKFLDEWPLFLEFCIYEKRPYTSQQKADISTGKEIKVSNQISNTFLGQYFFSLWGKRYYELPVYVIFNESHPERSTHGLFLRKYPVVPIMNGKRLFESSIMKGKEEDERKKEKEMKDEDKEKNVLKNDEKENKEKEKKDEEKAENVLKKDEKEHKAKEEQEEELLKTKRGYNARFCLGLFTAFRKVSDLIVTENYRLHGSDIDEMWYQQYLNHTPSELEMHIMKNIDEYHIGKRMERRKNEDNQNDQEHLPFGEGDEDVNQEDDNDIQNQSEDALVSHTNIFNQIEDAIKSRMKNHCNVPTMSNATNLDINSNIYKCNVQHKVWMKQIEDADKKFWDMEYGMTSNLNQSESSGVNNANFFELMDLFYSYFKEKKNCNGNKILNIGLLQSIYMKYNLNKEQIQAYMLISINLIIKVCKNLVCISSLNNLAEQLKIIIKELKIYVDEQIFMVVHGAAGCGKSRVIHAVIEFVTLCGMRNSLAVTATTTSAAILLGGETYHSVLGFTKGTKKITQKKVKKRLNNTQVLIIDEDSMLGVQSLMKIDIRCRELKGLPNVPFGGLSIILIGDFFQLKPVKDSPLYSNQVKGVLSKACISEYKKLFKSVVILRENWRQKIDPYYADLLLKIRTPPIADSGFILSFINSRYYDNSKKFNLKDIGWAPYIVKTNERRFDIITNNIKNACNLYHMNPNLNPIVYQFNATFKFKGKCKNSKDSEKEEEWKRFLLSSYDSELNFLSPKLYCYIGMHVLVTKKFSVAHGVANGTLAQIYGYVWNHIDDDKKVTKVYFKKGDGEDKNDKDNNHTNEDYFGHYCFIPDNNPKFILIKLLNESSISLKSKDKFEGLPDDVYPIQCISESVSRNVPKTVKYITAQMTQYPIVNADALTIHKVQGVTLTSSLLVPTLQGLTLSEVYTILTRIKSIDQLILFEELTTEIVSSWKLAAGLQEEMDRLESLSNNENITQIASFISKIQSNEDLNIMKQLKEESVFIEYVKELKSKSATVTDPKVTKSEDQKEYITQFDDKKNPEQKDIKKISKNIGKKKSVFISKSIDYSHTECPPGYEIISVKDDGLCLYRSILCLAKNNFELCWGDNANVKSFFLSYISDLHTFCMNMRNESSPAALYIQYILDVDHVDLNNYFSRALSETVDMNTFTWGSFNIACFISVFENIRIFIHTKVHPEGQIAGPHNHFNFIYTEEYHIVHQGNHYSALKKIQ